MARPPLFATTIAVGSLIWSLSALGMAQPSESCRQSLSELVMARPPSTTPLHADTAALARALFGAETFGEALRAGNRLLHESDEFADGTRVDAVLRILGPPEHVSDAQAEPGSGTLYYNTNGGPLQVAFSACRLNGKAMLRPARWRGTDAELAELWATVRTRPDWWWNWSREP